MNIICKEPFENGAYPAPQTWDILNIPEDYAPIADCVDMTDFFEHNGFVTLTIEPVQHGEMVERMTPVEKTREVEETFINEQGEEEARIVSETYWEEELVTVDETYTIDTVTGYTPNVEAWEAWKASLPEPAPEPEPPAPMAGAPDMGGMY